MEQRDDQLRILVGDDDEAMRETVALALEMEGYAAVPVGSSEALFGALQSNAWDLVILDTLGVRPEPAAFSLLEQVREVAGTGPTIVLTGSTATARWARVTGKFAGVLEKPIDVDVLFQVVADTLDASRRRQHAVEHWPTPEERSHSHPAKLHLGRVPHCDRSAEPEPNSGN